MTLTPPVGGGGGGGPGGNGGGDGGSPPPPAPTRRVTFSNQSPVNFILALRIDGGQTQMLAVPAGQNTLLENLAPCACLTVDEFTPPGASTVEGFALEVCDDAEAVYTASTGPFGGVTYTLTGGGNPTGSILFDLRNATSRDLTLFVFINARQDSTMPLPRGETFRLSVSRCRRLRVLARDASDAAVSAEFVESPAEIGKIYTCRDRSPTQIEFVQLP